MIKPIQTSYKGHLFRSRLEARWAVFFDALEMEWQYEPEGYELPNGERYLPDFFLRGGEVGKPYGPWLEVKGVAPTVAEINKLKYLCEDQCCYGFIVWGLPADNNFIHIHKKGHVDDAYDKLNDVHPFNCGSFANAAVKASRARFEFGGR